MLVGYARTSTFDQAAGFEAQVVELTRYGCDRLFQEQVSSVAHREQLDQALSFVRDGDVLVVTKLDRLARSVRHLWQLIETLQAKGVGLRILNMALDTNTATGKLMVSLLGAVAEFEREMLLERQRVGIERAKRDGKYRGRKPTARTRISEMRELRAQGLGASAIAQRVGVSRASVYRLLAKAMTSSSSGG
jgi:DNA invertase Pin-like site-specific DNA recombinase